MHESGQKAAEKRASGPRGLRERLPRGARIKIFRGNHQFYAPLHWQARDKERREARL
jgi:hypothetical protein